MTATFLAELAHDADLAPLWTAVHRRLCAGVPAESIASVRVENLSSAGTAVLRSWIDTTSRRGRDRSGVKVDGSSTVVPLRDVLAAIALPVAQLVPLVELAVGRPVVNSAALRRQASTRRRDLWAEVEARLPQLPGLVARMRAAGTDDVESTRHFVRVLAEVVAALPYRPPTSLAKLAHDLAGDPHYFDLDRNTGSRLVSAVAEWSGKPEPTRPDHVRSLLAKAGILADRLSSTVLLHQVRVVGDGPIDRRLREVNTPVAVTLLDLTVHPPVFAEQLLTVVENPSVLEAAMARGIHQAFACTSGHLGSVDHALLQLAIDQGVTLRYAGDLDGPGLLIARQVAEIYGATVVAMSADLVRRAGAEPSAVPFFGVDRVEDDLRDAITASGRVLFQEHDVVLDELL
ncbi:TIGR02679 domain-containing protein [Lentzea sp. JNUCC 0626]|uniref:TIGR02679 domain-containing protein n=1 Tax=Lentzea sp. JNUCC 0626 TaxID=3367513 RepID=UPI0037478499